MKKCPQCEREHKKQGKYCSDVCRTYYKYDDGVRTCACGATYNDIVERLHPWMCVECARAVYVDR